MSFFNELKRRNVLRVAAGYIVLAWLVVQVVETIFPAFGFGDETIRLVVIGFAVGFIPVVVTAWVFEWTPEGIRKDEGAEQQGPAVAAAAKRWDRIVMVILALAVAFFIVENILERPVVVEPTVAVLAFESGGLEPEFEYLSTSIPEGVHASISRVPELVVSFWPTVVKLRGEGLSSVEIAEKLAAPNYLDGTVQVVGDRIRIEARLIATASGRTIWAENYDGALQDIFVIQDEIAASALTNLQVGVSGPLWRSQRTNPETYRLTIQAWSVLNRVNQPNQSAIVQALLDKALVLDPNYLPAINALSMAAYRKRLDGEISEEDADLIVRDAQERVLASDPENGLSNVFLVWSTLFEDREFAHSNNHLQVALRTGLNDVETLRILSGFARRTGNVDAAIRLIDRALAVDPTCENCQWQQTENLFYARRFAEAIEAKKRYQMLGGGGYYNHGMMLLLSGEPELALEVFASSDQDGQKAAIQAMAYHALGDAEMASKNIAILEGMDGSYPLQVLAEVYAFRGDVDRAFEMLEKAVAMGGSVEHNLFMPQWEPLRSDPRWAALREQLDMSEGQLSLLDFSRILGQAQ
jgi:TolB-like protein/tetratricopeptide (TPR) repeat protein